MANGVIDSFFDSYRFQFHVRFTYLVSSCEASFFCHSSSLYILHTSNFEIIVVSRRVRRFVHVNFEEDTPTDISEFLKIHIVRGATPLIGTVYPSLFLPPSFPSRDPSRVPPAPSCPGSSSGSSLFTLVVSLPARKPKPSKLERDHHHYHHYRHTTTTTTTTTISRASISRTRAASLPHRGNPTSLTTLVPRPLPI